MKENNKLSLSDLEQSAVLRKNESILSALLKDHTTGQNIKWGTDSYINHGYSFRNDQEIKMNLITGWYEGFIRPRAVKDLEVQLERQRNKAEVFTPSWIIKLQVDAALEDMEELSLADFIQTKWLEITCGEAPYMVNRYDMETGEVIPLKDRSGFIDVKFKKLNQEIESEEVWLKLAVEIYKASYGYEYQGDSLLLARENLILTFIDNYFYMFGAFPNNQLILEISKVVSLNVIQMDGLTYEVPFSDGGTGEIGTQLSLFEEVADEKTPKPRLANVKLWNKNEILNFKGISERDDSTMKFDVVIGNPPYQNLGIGENARDEPIYNYFMDESYKVGKKSILITPGRFLFNAGQTSKQWNQKMLDDPNLKVLYYDPVSSNIFTNTKITGGIVITYHDNEKIIGPIDTFIAHKELRDITIKIKTVKGNVSKALSNIHYGKSSYKLTEDLYIDYPHLKNVVSKNEKKSISSNIYEKMPEVFTESGNNTIQLLMRVKNKRTIKSINRKYVENHPNLDKYKVVVPASNGSPAIGEAKNTIVIGTPEIINPGVGYSQTFISFGSFNNIVEAKNLLTYLKTKFVRAMVGTLKVTQHNQTKNVWSNVPLQDFTLDSDIDWTKSISEIDQQLYKKYNLTEEEINFVETNVKEME